MYLVFSKIAPIFLLLLYLLMALGKVLNQLHDGLQDVSVSLSGWILGGTPS